MWYLGWAKINRRHYLKSYRKRGRPAAFSLIIIIVTESYILCLKYLTSNYMFET